MSKSLRNISKNKINILVIFSLWFIQVFYRKYFKSWKAKRDFKKYNKITICSFYPTCSEYGILALKKYGFIKGCYLTIKRIKRCNTYKHKNSCIDYP